MPLLPTRVTRAAAAAGPQSPVAPAASPPEWDPGWAVSAPRNYSEAPDGPSSRSGPVSAVAANALPTPTG
jgi:hypothetical protein